MKSFARTIVKKLLATYARTYLRRTRPTIIFVCGGESRGVVAHAIAKKLGSTARVRSNPKGYTFDIGIPLSILGLEAGFTSPIKWLRLLMTAAQAAHTAQGVDALVLEVGIAHEGDTKAILAIARPTIVVIADEPPQALQTEYELLKKTAQSAYEPSTFTVSEVAEEDAGTSFAYTYKGSKQRTSVNAFGRHHIFSAAVANTITL